MLLSTGMKVLEGRIPGRGWSGKIPLLEAKLPSRALDATNSYKHVLTPSYIAFGVRRVLVLSIDTEVHLPTQANAPCLQCS